MKIQRSTLSSLKAYHCHSYTQKNYPQVLHPAAASVNMNKTILGENVFYAQDISRRIHYGMYVAEVKYREASKEYGAAIRAENRKALMKLLTFNEVEEMVKRRVAKKAMVFGQDVTLNKKMDVNKLKINPVVVSRLYEDWVIPFTKEVEVNYLLRRLD